MVTRLPSPPVLVAGLVGLAAVGLALYIWRKGGAGPAGAAVGSAAVELAGGVASGAVGAVGAAVGLPAPSETLTDPRQVRYLIDRLGYFEASKWAGAPALFSAWSMAAGTGTPPPSSTPAGRMLAALPGAVIARPRWADEDTARAGGGTVDPALFDPYSPFNVGA